MANPNDPVTVVEPTEPAAEPVILPEPAAEPTEPTEPADGASEDIMDPPAGEKLAVDVAASTDVTTEPSKRQPQDSGPVAHTVIHPVVHDGKPLERGDTLSLSESDAAPYVAAGVLVPSDVDVEAHLETVKRREAAAAAGTAGS